MPMTVYADGSGTHGDSEILTLAVCVMASEVIEPFMDLWNGTLARHGLTELHMRKFDWSFSGMPTDAQQIICDILNAISRFSRDFLYLRSCSVVKADYKEAKRKTASLKPAEHAKVLCWLKPNGKPPRLSQQSTFAWIFVWEACRLPQRIKGRTTPSLFNSTAVSPSSAVWSGSGTGNARIQREDGPGRSKTSKR